MAAGRCCSSCLSLKLWLLQLLVAAREYKDLRRNKDLISFSLICPRSVPSSASTDLIQLLLHHINPHLLHPTSSGTFLVPSWFDIVLSRGSTCPPGFCPTLDFLDISSAPHRPQRLQRCSCFSRPCVKVPHTFTSLYFYESVLVLLTAQSSLSPIHTFAPPLLSHSPV